ncbi:hypothetical protein AA80_06450 [Petrotoga sibirica DSM 13575]|uniref:HEPN AbiU2-like domain-containing protein n=2 Tax=Petrotoga sibirica TaxID=156202 RepID=A0A4R8ED73_9BACT|nr:hypothetical protein AA80_06450 [Petrotoga sibirica DSM 13575]TDX09634.1 hypothetical protein C8D74_1273 [Petrotoga sibirica]
MCLEQIENKFKKFREKFIDELKLLDSKYSIFITIQDAKENKIEGLEVAPVFFSVIENSLVSDLIISLSRLYEGYNRDGSNKRKQQQYTIKEFLNFLESHPKFTKKYNIELEQIEAHKNDLEEKKTLIKNIFKWRNKYYAHADFTKLEKIKNTAKVKYEDIRCLIDFAYDILNYYFVQFDGINHGIDLDYNKDLNNLLDMTIRYKKIRKEYFKNRKNIQNFIKSNKTNDVRNFLIKLEQIIFGSLPKGVDRKKET